MDDQNQTNQPLNQGSPPVVPIAPLDITPPVTPAEPIVVPPEVPPLSTPVPDVSPLPLPTAQPEIGQPVIETPATEEVPMPKAKHKSKIMPIMGGVVALLLVVGVAGAAYYVSNQLSTRQAVAPNAPTSKPLATNNPDVGDVCGTSGDPIEHRCLTSEICCCTGCTSDGNCDNHGGVTCPDGGNGGSDTTTGRQHYCNTAQQTTISMSEMKPGDSATITSYSNTNVNGFFYSVYNLDNMYGPSNPKPVCVTGLPNYDYQCPIGSGPLLFSADGTNLRTSGSVTIPYESLFVADTNYLDGNGSPKIPTNVQFNAYFSLNGGEWGYPEAPCVTSTKMASVSDPDICAQQAIADKYSLGTEDSITLTAYINPNSGPVDNMFFGVQNLDNDSDRKVICSSHTSTYPWLCPNGGGQLHLSGNITGNTATLTVPYERLFGLVDTNTGIKPKNIRFWAWFQKNGAAYGNVTNKCIIGPVTTAVCIPDGTITCSPDCSTACSTDASTITTCTDSCGAATTKTCGATAACPPGEVGKCESINIYKKVGTDWGVPLSLPQLQTLKVGDIVKATMETNMGNLRGQFGLTINGVFQVWVDGTISGNTITSQEVPISAAGTYEVSGRVSTTP